MSINFNCSNIIIVRYYGGGSGGEFLKNCLSLSNSSVMSHTILAELQLNGKLNYGNKVNFLNSKISSNPLTVWKDIGLYGSNLIGTDFEKFGKIPPEEYCKLKFNPIMDRLTNKQEKYFFIKIHDHNRLNNVLEAFPNAKIIEVINEDLFITIRNCNNINSFFSFLFDVIAMNPKICPNIHEKWKDIETYPELNKKHLISIVHEDFAKLLANKPLMESLKKEYHEQLVETKWNNIGNNKWPSYSKYIREYMKLDIKLRNEIQNTLNLNYFILKWDDRSKFMNKHSDKIIYTWDTNWYFSLEDTLKGFKELYELLRLDNYDQTSLSLVYNSWIDKIDEMKKFQLSK
jgi:hypothetical protein